MNADLKESFSRIKPVCDVVMVCPSAETITNFTNRVSELKKEVVQELQQYLLFPFITHLKSSEIEKKYELQSQLVDGMKMVLEKVTVNSYEMCMKIETSLLQLVFDNSKPGMVADVPEELKHSVMKCLTTLMLNIDKHFREKFLKTQVPLVAQAVFVAVHIAKLEKLRALRLAAIHCVTAHTMTHSLLTNDKYRIMDSTLEAHTVEMLASILPGVLAALQDVATCTNNPGHAVIVASLEAIHRILCTVMGDRLLSRKTNISVEDFARSFKETVQIQKQEKKEVSCKEKQQCKAVPKRSLEWYRMAGDKLTVVTKSLLSLRTHEHVKVRKELAVFCSRVLNECTLTMQPSQPIVLDILITLSKDEYPSVSEYCSHAVSGYFANACFAHRHRVMESLCENFFIMLNGLPRILNNIDSDRKLSALNLLHGYVEVLCDDGRPQRLTSALSGHRQMKALCMALSSAAALHSRLPLLATHAAPDLTAAPPTGSPWVTLRHIDSEACCNRFRQICGLLGRAEAAELILDRLLEMFQRDRPAEILYIINNMVAESDSSSFVCRVIDTYIEEDVWYLPLEVGEEAPPEQDETLDLSVYNPRAWTTDSVPGLYEGTVETRYTGVSYARPRPCPGRWPQSCATAAQAQRNMLLGCLLTAGLGRAARALAHSYRPYLLRTLCSLLERVGSKYEMLHLAGLKALNDVAAACGHQSVTDLIRTNADYFTNQVTLRLKKAWNSQSALEILSVVMEYTDQSLLDCLYGIVRDVLVQSCDKYYERNLYAYLQVFLAFVDCIRKWFPVQECDAKAEDQNVELDLTKDLLDYIKHNEEAERLMTSEEFEKDAGRSVEEMYREDLKSKEDNLLDYDDKVAEGKPPLPQHVSVTVTILKRCVNFVSCRRRDEAVLALLVLRRGLPLLRQYDDELLPLVHQIWGPLATRFEEYDPVVLRRALDLLVTMATLSKDFIHARCVKEVLPHIYKYLQKTSQDSLKESATIYCASSAYELQAASMRALPSLVVDLRLKDEKLDAAMDAFDVYLSCKQPKPLQVLAVDFFKAMLEYDYGAAWHHLRTLCNNQEVLQPPAVAPIKLEPVIGTPYVATNKDYATNIKLIFEEVPNKHT